MLDVLPFGGGVSLGLGPGSIVGSSKWANLKNENKMLNIVVIGAVGAIVVDLQQAKDLTGTGAKVLDIERIYRKKDVIGAVVPDLFVAVAGIDNENPVASFSTAVAPATVSTVNDMLLIRVRPHDLDVENGFSAVRVNVSGAGASDGVVIFVPEEPAYKGADSVGVLDD